jgi:hypothetical protein
MVERSNKPWFQYVLLSLFSFITLLHINHCVAATYNDATLAAVHLQIVDVDLDVEGTLRETEFGSFQIEIREPLAKFVDGGLLFGYLGTKQRSNPIVAGQSMSGGYFGFDLNFHLVDTQAFKLDGIFDYRYSETSASIDDQRVEWSWHQTRTGAETRTYFGSNVAIELGAYYLTINGEERARGPLNQNLDFEAKDSLTAHIELQLALDQSGQISFAYITGSAQGGRISFQQSF